MNYEIQVPPQPENPAKEIWKVLRLQLGIFAIYQMGLAILTKSEANGETFMFLDLFLLLAHWIVLLVFMGIKFSQKKKGAAFGYLISFVTIAIIGFGSCWFMGGM
jgi:hypothetical protein